MADADSTRAKVGVTRATCLGVGLALGGCGGVDTGVVEVQWVWVDRDGDPIFPAGQFVVGNRDSCDLPGSGGTSYALSVELQICDPACVDDLTTDYDPTTDEVACGSEACQVMSPLHFSCETARGSNPDVPSSDEDYLFYLRPLIRIAGSEQVCRKIPSTCIAAPAPRERKVEPGLVTDLQVYQFVVDVEQSVDDPLDLGACCDEG